MRHRPSWPRINRTAPLGKGLVLGLFGGGAGTSKAFDASGYGNDGTLMDMDPPTDWVWAPELGRWAVDFDGTNDAIFLPVFKVNGWAQISMTIWIDQYSSGVDVPLSVPDGLTTQCAVLVILSSTTFRTDVNAAGNTLSVSTTTGLHHVAMTYDGASKKSYWDGVLQESAAISGALETVTDELNIGRFSSFPINNFGGRLSDAAIWNRALCPTELAALADPSNVDLRLGGSSLIQEPRPRRNFVGYVAPAAGGNPWNYYAQVG